jgi:UDP-2,3-diacylglucosamine hydrolase
MHELINATAENDSSQRRIGLIAGWGRFPIQVAESLLARGDAVYCIGIGGHADKALAKICTDYQEIGLGRFSSQLRFFRRHGVTQATLAGKIFKTKLIEKFGWIRCIPDWKCLKAFYPFFVTKTRNANDDMLLGCVVQAYGSEGVDLVPATDLAPELLVSRQQLSQRGLSHAESLDVQFGWNIAKQMGGLDIGQSVVVKSRMVVSVEAIEGTDECIRRAGKLCKSGGFTVIKVAKPQQDMRFDVPTIGVGTLETLLEAGGRVLAVEANKTILLDERAVIEFANRHRLTLVALSHAEDQLILNAA